MPTSLFQRVLISLIAALFSANSALVQAATPPTQRIIAIIADRSTLAQKLNPEGRGYIVIQQSNTGLKTQYSTGTLLNNRTRLIAVGKTAILIESEGKQLAIALGQTLPSNRRILINRQELMKLISQLSDLKGQLEIQPIHQQQGSGVLITTINQRLSKKLGVYKNDFLLQLNAIELNPSLNIWALMTELGTENLFQLKLIRNGKSHLIKYQLQ